MRVTAGVRIVPDGQDLLNGESLESLAARLADARRPANADLTVSAGSSWFALPDMKMVTVVGGPFFDQALGQETNGSGNLNGWRTDARLANFAEGRLPDGTPASFGVSGFFANYQGTTQSHCMYSLTTDCAIVNIVDFDPNNENNTGPFGNSTRKGHPGCRLLRRSHRRAAWRFGGGRAEGWPAGQARFLRSGWAWQ